MKEHLLVRKQLLALILSELSDSLIQFLTDQRLVSNNQRSKEVSEVSPFSLQDPLGRRKKVEECNKKRPENKKKFFEKAQKIETEKKGVPCKNEEDLNELNAKAR